MDSRKNVVVATGGGLPCFFDNIEWINAHGLSVYLKVPVGMLIQRLLQDKGERPTLEGLSETELADKVRSQLELRDVYYNSSKIIFDVAHKSLDSLVKEISDFKQV